MARLWSSGFELNSVTNGIDWDTNSGSPTISSTTFRSGAYAGRISSLSSTTAKFFSHQVFGAEIALRFYYRFYFRVDTLPSAENRIAVWNDAASGSTPSVYMSIDNSGVLKLYDEDGQITGTTTLSTGVWYRVEAHIDTEPAAGSMVVEARVDGVNFASSSTRNIASTNFPFHWVLGGNLNGEAQTTGDWFFCDCAINNVVGSFQNSWPGEGEIIHLRPNANGDVIAFSRGGADSGANWSQVEEVTPNDATDNITDNVLNETDDYDLDATPAALASDDTINCVQVGFRFNATSSTGTDPETVLRIKASSGGTTEESSATSHSTSTWHTNATAAPKDYKLTLYDLPGASTTAWTKADLDTTQIGVRVSTGDTDNAQVTAMWLLVDHKPTAAGGTVVKDLIQTGFIPFAR